MKNSKTLKAASISTALLINLVLTITSGYSQTLVKAFSNNPVHLTDVNGVLYFSLNTNGDFGDLWKSDGTPGGTVLVKDINPGIVTNLSSSYKNGDFTDVNGILYFQASGADGYELWKSDGTEAGTVMVKDINPGISSGHPEFLTNMNGVLYFQADDGTNGAELWKSDGTDAGTVMVKAIESGSWGADPSDLTVMNGFLYFRANNGTNGAELWKSDGTVAGTVMVKDIPSGSGGSYPDHLTNVNGTLYFTAENYQTTGTELWKSDGTDAGTMIVKDIFSGTSSSMPEHLINVNGSLYFRARDGVNGLELWKSDGTDAGTFMVKDIRVGSDGSNSSNEVSLNGIVYFIASDGVSAGYKLWRSDGTSGGTFMVNSDVNLNSSDITPVDSVLYFAGATTGNGVEFWKSDGTDAGTVMIQDIFPGNGGSNPHYFTSLNGALYFIAEDLTGDGLWKYDGSTISGINETINVSTLFSVYPNPSNDFVLIKNKNGKLNSSYSITNSLGEKILTGTLVDEDTRVDMNLLSSGIYFLQIGEVEKQTYKLIKK